MRAYFNILCFAFITTTHGFNTAFFSNPKTSKNIDAKKIFFEALESDREFNSATKVRTKLLDELTITNPTKKPGSLSSFLPIAPGTWQIIYAPHISTLSKLAGGSFDPVLYKLQSKKDSQIIVSHAKYSFPILGEGWLSVSGTYGTEDGDGVCRVDFDRAWIGVGSENKFSSYEEAPEEWYKNIINSVGKLGFRKEFAAFPVSYLDQDTIVFDFELFGTRICAKKISQN